MYRFTLCPPIRSLTTIIRPIHYATVAVVVGALVLSPISPASAAGLLSPPEGPVNAVPITSELPIEAGGNTEAGAISTADALETAIAVTSSECIAQEVTVTIGEAGESCWDRCHMMASRRVNSGYWTEAFAEAMFPKCHATCECIESGAPVC